MNRTSEVVAKKNLLHESFSGTIDWDPLRQSADEIGDAIKQITKLYPKKEYQPLLEDLLDNVKTSVSECYQLSGLVGNIELLTDLDPKSGKGLLEIFSGSNERIYKIHLATPHGDFWNQICQWISTIVHEFYHIRQEEETPTYAEESKEVSILEGEEYSRNLGERAATAISLRALRELRASLNKEKYRNLIGTLNMEILFAEKILELRSDEAIWKSSIHRPIRYRKFSSKSALNNFLFRGRK